MAIHPPHARSIATSGLRAPTAPGTVFSTMLTQTGTASRWGGDGELLRVGVGGEDDPLGADVALRHGDDEARPGGLHRLDGGLLEDLRIRCEERFAQTEYILSGVHHSPGAFAHAAEEGVRKTDDQPQEAGPEDQQSALPTGEHQHDHRAGRREDGKTREQPRDGAPAAFRPARPACAALHHVVFSSARSVAPACSPPAPTGAPVGPHE
ncbi:hypothetical protein GCM10017688_15890 [Streptomyces ramulosus]